MLEVLYRQKAISDLDGIWHLTAEKFGPDFAGKYLKQLESSVGFFAEHPEEASKIDDISKGMITWGSGASSVYAARLKDKLIVTRILHEDDQI